MLCALCPVSPTACNTRVQCHSQDATHSRHRTLPPRRPLRCSVEPHRLLSLPHPAPNPWWTDLLSISVILSFQKCHINGTTQSVTFGDWLFSLSTLPWRFIHVAGGVTSSFLLTTGWYSVSGWTTVCLAIHLLKDTWVVSSFLAITNKAAMNICVQVLM